jgi:hypothetical protein
MKSATVVQQSNSWDFARHTHLANAVAAVCDCFQRGIGDVNAARNIRIELLAPSECDRTSWASHRVVSSLYVKDLNRHGRASDYQHIGFRGPHSLTRENYLLHYGPAG